MIHGVGWTARNQWEPIVRPTTVLEDLSDTFHADPRFFMRITNAWRNISNVMESLCPTPINVAIAAFSAIGALKGVAEWICRFRNARHLDRYRVIYED